ncbi:MAG: sulfite exporter TauE/SafE family protein [Pseudomonadota bacterium]
MIFDGQFYVIAAVVVLLTGVSKAGFGAGLEMMAVPVMALFIAPQLAAAIMLPILLAIDAANLWRYRNDWDRSILTMLLPAALVGIVIGAFTFEILNADMLRFGLGILALLFVVQRLVLQRMQAKSGHSARPAGPFMTRVFGAMGGFTSYVAHAGGPLIKMVLISHELKKQGFVGTNSYLFASINFLKLFPYLWLGQITTDSFVASLWLAPFIPVGVLFGFWLNGRVSEKNFSVIIIVALAAIGIRLVWDGGTSIF